MGIFTRFDSLTPRPSAADHGRVLASMHGRNRWQIRSLALAETRRAGNESLNGLCHGLNSAWSRKVGVITFSRPMWIPQGVSGWGGLAQKTLLRLPMTEEIDLSRVPLACG